jgi:pimeloyl-ACP methyl ester carboxylesterase
MKKIIIKSTGFYLNTLAYVNPELLKRKGYELFCNPFSKKVQPHHLVFLQTAEMFNFNFEEKKMQAYKWGSGSKKVILMHGWASNTFRWRKIIEKLIQDDFTVYAFDAPGHGLSEGKLLNLLIYKNCLEVFLKKVGKIDYAIAHSVGGFTLQYMLYDNKTSGIKKAVVMGAPGEADDFFVFYKELLSLSKKSIRLIIEQFENKLGNQPSFFSAKKFAKEIDIPVLLIHDKYDKDTNPNYTEQLSKLIKNNTLIMTEGLGHNLKSKELDNQIIDFINEYSLN